MRRAMVIGAAVLVLLALIGIGVGVYNAGVHDGIAQGLQQSGENTQVVRVIDGGYRHGYGFFPFGFFLFPLLVVIGFFLLARAAFWRGRWGGPWRGGPYGGGWGGPGPWGQGGPHRYEEWHRRQHEPQEADQQQGATDERTPGGQADL